jgi:hypothetical protein
MNIIDLGSAADRLGVLTEAPESDRVLGLLGRDPGRAAR